MGLNTVGIMSLFMLLLSGCLCHSSKLTIIVIAFAAQQYPHLLNFLHPYYSQRDKPLQNVIAQWYTQFNLTLDLLV
jgi:heme/copper-type cytochrome/quinol oxidase subunit 4